jgi:hypothetical protein
MSDDTAGHLPPPPDIPVDLWDCLHSLNQRIWPLLPQERREEILADARRDLAWTEGPGRIWCEEVLPKIAATRESLDTLAAHLPGQPVSNNPLTRLVLFVAHEYGWDPEVLRRLTYRQIILFTKQALQAVTKRRLPAEPAGPAGIPSRARSSTQARSRWNSATPAPALGRCTSAATASSGPGSARRAPAARGTRPARRTPAAEPTGGWSREAGGAARRGHKHAWPSRGRRSAWRRRWRPRAPPRDDTRPTPPARSAPRRSSSAAPIVAQPHAGRSTRAAPAAVCIARFLDSLPFPLALPRAYNRVDGTSHRDREGHL